MRCEALKKLKWETSSVTPALSLNPTLMQVPLRGKRYCQAGGLRETFRSIWRQMKGKQLS